MATRHTIDVDLGGNAEAGLGKLESGVRRVGDAAEKANSQLRKGGDGVEAMAAKTNVLDRLSNRLESLGSRFSDAAASIRGRSEGFVREIMSDAATFEDAQAEMRFAFGSSWEKVFADVKKDAADLTFTFEQTSKLASSLGRMKINPFGGTEESQQVFKSKTGENIRALAVLQDTADAVGRGADDLVVSIRNAMAGTWRSLEDRFDIPKERIREWRKEIDKLKDPQEKYNALVKHLGEMFGGAGKEKALNYNKIIAQIPDLLQQIRAGAGMAGLRLITEGMRDLVNALASIANDKDIMASLADGFKVIGWVIGKVVSGIALFVGYIRDLIKNAPWLPKLVAILGGAATVFVAVAGALAGAAATIAGFVAGLKMLGVTLGGLAAGAALIIPLMAGAAALFTVLGVGANAASKIIESSFGGVAATLTKVNLVWKGLSESIASYNGETSEMSLETAQALGDAGLMGTVNKLMSVWHKLNLGFDAFLETLDEAWIKLAPTMIPMFEEFGDLVSELGDALGITAMSLDDMNAPSDSFTAKGREIAGVLIRMTEIAVKLARAIIAITRTIVELGRALADVYRKIEKVVEGFSKMTSIRGNPVIDAALGAPLESVIGKKKAKEPSFGLNPVENAKTAATTAVGEWLAKRRGGKLFHERAAAPVATTLQDRGLSEEQMARLASTAVKGSKFEGLGLSDSEAFEALLASKDKRVSRRNIERILKNKSVVERPTGMDLEYARTAYPSLAAAAAPATVKTKDQIKEEAKADEAKQAAAAEKHNLSGVLAEFIKFVGNKPIVLEVDGVQLAKVARKADERSGGPF